MENCWLSAQSSSMEDSSCWNSAKLPPKDLCHNNTHQDSLLCFLNYCRVLQNPYNGQEILYRYVLLCIISAILPNDVVQR